MKVCVLLEVDEDGVFVAEVPILHGCVSQGKTREEALQNAREAVSVYLESLRENRDPFPPSIGEEVIDLSVG